MEETETSTKGQLETPTEENDMARETWEMEMHEKYTTTWKSPGGKARRQIDYIMISATCRNTAKKAESNIYCHANMGNNQPHRVQTVQIRYDAAKKYEKPIPDETGGRLKYDIKELRLHPKKLKNGTMG